MDLLKTLLATHRDRIAFVLVLCDSWDSESFRSQHLGDLRKFAGIPFLCVVVGSPDSVLAPVAIEGAGS